MIHTNLFFFLFCLNDEKKSRYFQSNPKLICLKNHGRIKKPWLLQHPIESQHILLLKLCGNLAGFSVETKQENLYLIRVVCGPISLCITLISLTQIGNPVRLRLTAHSSLVGQTTSRPRSDYLRDFNIIDMFV